MFDMQARLIGIVSHNISKGGGSVGLGFVVTLNTARQLLLERRSFWSGLEGLLLSDEQADLLNLPPRTTGYIVKTVAKNSPGDQIGLRGGTQVVRISGQDIPLGGDVILSVEGVPASGPNLSRIREAMNQRPPGAPFRVTILRAGQVLELTGTLP
jgi:S1-C subfamily serine protease